MNDRELKDAAWLELTKTTDSYPKWKLRGYPPATGWGRAKSFLDQIGLAAPPPPPPPLPSGTLLDQLSDFDTRWGRQCVNRWLVSPIGADPFTAENSVGSPWPGLSGAAILEVSTQHGPGFRFLGPAEAQVGSGGKKVEIHDHLHTRGNGFTDVFSWRLMYPAAGNPNGFHPDNYSANANYAGHHDAGTGRLPAWWGINPLVSPNRFYMASQTVKNLATDAEAQASPRYVLGPNLVYDQWYLHRHEIKWSAGSDGYIKWYMDGVLIAQFNGVTIHDNDTPNLQFGVYGRAFNLNEQIYADFRKYH